MPMSCTVTETLNGEWELTLVHDIDERGKWTQLSEGCILRAPVPAAMTPSVDLVTQQYQTSTYDVQIYKITTRSGPLHLRSGTGTNYKILGKYKKGREVIVLNKTTSSWYEVTAPDGKHGYMASQYLTFQRTETQAVQTNVGFRNQVIEARQLRDQPFRIYRVVPELDKVTVYARNIFYDLLDNMIKSLKPSPSAVGASVVQSLSEACLSSHDFSFYSDLTSTAEDVEWENVNPVEAMLGENGLVSKYGAELARDWYDVFLVRRVGNNTDVSIREKKNLTGISYDVDETDVVTRIMPTGEDTDGNILYLPELYLDSPNINAYTHPKWIHLPVSEAKEVTDGDEPKSKAQCYAEMRKAAQAEFDAGCDLPTVTLKVDFVNCSDAEEYKQYAALTDIFLGDSVRVIARRIGVEVSMRMTQYTYDCLTRKYISVTLGTAADTLEGSMISSRQLPSGVISGSKLAINSVGAGQLQSGSVGSLQVKMAAIQTAHIQDAAITKAKIAEATIGELNATAITAISAKIQELAANNITTDELYAALATIAVAQITAANIEKANINWADIGELAAQIATIAQAQITTANINSANIDWASIANLNAEIAKIANADGTVAQTDGTKVRISAKASGSSVGGKNTLACTVYYKLSSAESWVSAVTLAPSNYAISETNRLLSPTFDALSSYDIKIRVQDVFYYIEQTVSIGTKQVMMDFYKDGSGIAFGKVAENAGKVEFGWPLLLSEPLGVDQGGTGAETASAACTKLGAVKKNGDTMTGNLAISGYLYPSLYLLPTYNSTTNRTVFEGSYVGASSFSSWEDGTGNNRRMLEVRNAAYQASLDFAVLLRTCTGGTWASYRLFHAGMATPIPLANGGTGASSAKAALSNLGIFYSASLPSSGMDGQICLVPV